MQGLVAFANPLLIAALAPPSRAGGVPAQARVQRFVASFGAASLIYGAPSVPPGLLEALLRLVDHWVGGISRCANREAAVQVGGAGSWAEHGAESFSRRRWLDLLLRSVEMSWHLRFSVVGKGMESRRCEPGERGRSKFIISA